MKKSVVVWYSLIFINIIIISCKDHKKVTQFPLTGFTLSDQSVTLNLGQKKTVEIVSYIPSNATDVSAPEWTTGSDAVATVAQNGEITAAGEGAAEVICAINGIWRAVAVDVVSEDSQGTISVGNSTEMKVTSIGAEFDPHFFSQNVTRNANPADWDIIVKRVTDMKISGFRVMVFPEWYEPVNDNDDPFVIDWTKFTFDSQEMQSLYKVLDLAQENDVRVTLVLWGAHKLNMQLLNPEYAHIRDHFLAQGSKCNSWMVAPTNVDEWCENFSALIQYLVFVKRYTCIKEITPVNEPALDYFDNVTCRVNTDAYINMFKKLDARFKADNIRDKVLFNSDDYATQAPYYTALSKVADLHNSHLYIFGYESKNSEMLELGNSLRQLTQAIGKRHFIGEFGSNQTVGASRQTDIDLYERGILLARQTLNMLNAGMSGVSYWILFDQHYMRTGSYGEMQQLGLWRYKKEDYASEPYFNAIKCDYEPRPQYYAYSLLTRFIRPGSDVHPIDLKEDFAVGSAFKNANGKWSYIFANGTERKITVPLKNEHLSIDVEFDVHKYIQNELPDDDSMIQSSGNVTTKSKKLKIDLPARSVIVYQQK